VVAAVGLFCGSAYLLLSTNLGARLGFLVSAAGLTGFMVLLTTLWWTSGNQGIDPPHGNSPSWKVLEIAENPGAAKNSAVHDIAAKGKKVNDTLLTNLKPALDAALVTPPKIANQEAKVRPLAEFDSSLKYIPDFKNHKAYVQGGGTKNVIWHHPRYAAVEFCTSEVDAGGNPVTPPRCDPLKPTRYAILRQDLGSLRQPTIAYWFMSMVLFALSLLGLHWYEQDERARKRTALTPVPTPGA
jgi:hypothetical protein